MWLWRDTLIHTGKCIFQQSIACKIFDIFCPSYLTMVRIQVKLKVVKFYSIFLQYNSEKLFWTLKSFFCSQDIQVFVFPSWPTVSLCSRRWLKINDWCHQLAKQKFKNIVWYFEKESRSYIEAWSIDRNIL